MLKYFLISFIGFFYLLSTTPVQADIYQWTDEHGITQFSEHPPDGKIPSQEISQQIAKVGNFFEMAKTVSIDWYQPPITFTGVDVTVDLELINYQVDPSFHQAVKSGVNHIYETYARWFGWAEKPSRPIHIKLFGKFNEFERYQKQAGDRLIKRTSHYSLNNREVRMIGTEFSQKTLSVLYHEASHAIMHMEIRYTPPWINEGISEVFETLKVINGKPTIGLNISSIERIKRKQREGSLLNAEQYLSINNQEWHSQSSRVKNENYRIAWSMMRFLVSSQEGITALRNILQLGKNSRWYIPEVLIELFDHQYPGGIQRFNQDWQNWLREI